jgi:two-component system nitrogen regulation response regulator GlnG
VLQDQQFEPVGGNQTVRTDVRLIAATNRDLPALMSQGRFRGDLYYRLNVSTIRLPPLRDRGDDVPLLVQYYLRRFGREMGKDVQTVTPEAMDLLRKYAWPGNVRELQSTIKQALLQATGQVLLPEFLPEAVRGGRAPAAALAGGFAEVSRFVAERLGAGTTDLHGELIARVERQLFAEVLRHTGGNMTQAARVLGITRGTLRTKLAALGLAGERPGSEDAE